MRGEMLVYGRGLNDCGYPVMKVRNYYDKGKRKGELLWMCKYYSKWKGMLYRCYGRKNFDKNYYDVTVEDEWMSFSKFREWCLYYERRYSVDIKFLELDKDILLKGNKVYSKSKCCFVPTSINTFITTNKSRRGKYKLGVSYVESRGKFKAKCSDFFNKNKSIFLGYFDSEDEAHLAYVQCKADLANKIVLEGILSYDKRIEQALIKYVSN